jgi:hypothetical protein
MRRVSYHQLNISAMWMRIKLVRGEKVLGRLGAAR